MIETEELISRFQAKIAHKYPTLTVVDLGYIVRAPFVFLRKQMKMDHLPRIRFKYLGVFFVKKKTLDSRAKVVVQSEDDNTNTEEDTITFKKQQPLIKYDRK